MVKLAQAVLEKLYPCKACKGDIRLQLKDDDRGWLRFEPDGRTVHDCPATTKKKTSVGGRTGEYARLEAKIDALTAEVKALRQEVKQRK